MKEEYKVMFQLQYDYEKGKWCNAGWMLDGKLTYSTLEEALKCKQRIIDNERHRGNKNIYIANGIGVTIENDEEDIGQFELRRIIIEKRQVTPWEEI